MNKDRRGLAMLLSGILRRVRNGQSTSSDAVYLAAIMRDLLIQTNNHEISDFVVDHTYDKLERDAMDRLYQPYEGIL